jgi:rod shape-determining protein MreC
MIGTIDNINLPDEANFYEVDIKLANDFSKLSHVYVIQNSLKEELHSTEQLVTGIND